MKLHSAIQRRKAICRARQTGTSSAIARLRRACEPLERRLLMDATIVFNEINYHPPAGQTEWVELHNQMAVDMDMSKWSFGNGINYTFPQGTIIKGGANVVIAASTAGMPAGTLGPFTGSLDNSGEKLSLLDNSGREMDAVTYDDGGDAARTWPAGADGGGVTLAKFDPDAASDVAANWRISEQLGGTPGARNFAPPGGFTTQTLIADSAPVKVFVPSNGSLGSTWTDPAFNDSSWTSGQTGVGFGSLAPPVTALGYWNLNDNAADTSGNNFTGSLRNGPTYSADVPAKIGSGKSLTLDGVDDSFITPNVTSPFNGGDTVTMSLWFKPRAGGAGGVVLSEVGDSSTNPTWHDSQIEVQTNGVVNVRVWSLSALTLGTASFGNWHHVVVRYDGAADKLDGYLDGIKSASSVSGDRMSPIENGYQQYWTMGAADSTSMGNGRNFDGQVDDFAVWTRALTDAQSLALFNGTVPTNISDAVPPPIGPTIAYNYLTGAAGTQAYGGSLGHDFRVNFPTTITQLGVFDSGADGLGQTLVSQLWSRSGNGGTKLAELSFTPGSPGTLVNSNRLKPLPQSITLQPGDYSIVAYGYGPGELNGNLNTGGPSAQFRQLNDGSGQITFVGSGRYGTAGAFPTSFDNFAAPYSAPTFEYVGGISDLAKTDTSGSMRDVNASAYIRTPFTVADPSSVASLSLRVRYDDGFVAYVNGVEVARRNAPSVLAYNSSATSAQVGFSDETFDLTAFRSALRPGANVLSIQGLNAGASDGDFLIYPNLTATISPANTKLAINETGAAGAGFFIELMNFGDGVTPIGGFQVVSSAGQSYTLPTQNLAPGARLSITAATLGFTPANGDKIFLKAGRVLDSAVVDSVVRGRSPEGTGPWLYPSSATPGAANVFTLNNSIVVNEVMFHDRSVPAVAGQTTSVNLVPINAIWRYEQSGTDLGTGWRAPAYNDANWASGRGILAAEDAPLTATKNTTLTLGRNTYYFRTSFSYSGAAGVSLSVKPFVDDGAVFYLNGQEIYRYNMPSGTIGYSSAASTQILDASYSGPFTIPASALINGANTLAVEVHQNNTASSDITFGAELNAVTTVVAPQPFHESPMEWVELYNKSAAAVDLSGWKFDDAVSYTFPAGTILGAGQYLVVSNDAATLQGQFPSARVLGNFTKTLSNDEDTIRLLDSANNPADEVHYFGGGNWPAYADGGGSSMELKDPNSDNAAPQAWTDSNESGRSSWKTYTYTAVATTSNSSGADSAWKEFALGMLDKSDLLLDDISVRDMSNGGQQLLQNMDFSTGLAHWRIGGNHHGTVITDPTNPANKVLHLVTEGGTEHYLNHAETTLTTAVVNGHTYEISFRAKLIDGSNEVNTRLWYDRAAKTTLIDVPALRGTPGSANSMFGANVGPTFSNLMNGPVVPEANQPVTISVTAQDNNGVAAVNLKWKTDSSGWNTLPMTGAGGNYAATIPGQPAATIVQFYVEGTDTLGAVSTYPDTGANARALYKVNDAGVFSGSAHNVRVIVTSADLSWLFDRTNIQSDGDVLATVIYDDKTVYYNVGVRLKGSLYGRNDSVFYGLVVHFNADQKFRGSISSIALDRSNRGPQGSPSPEEIMVRHMINAAGGVPMFYDDLTHVVTPSTGDQSYALLQMDRWSGNFWDGLYDNGGDGSDYEFEVISYAAATTDGNPESPKVFNVNNPYYDTDLKYLGADEEVYRQVYQKKDQTDADDFSDVMRLGQMMDLPSGDAIDAASKDVIDVDEWLRAFATESLAGNSDFYSWGAAHNLRLFDRPTDGKFVAMPHDMDSSFTRGTDASLYGGGNISKIISLPGNLHMYYGHLKDIVDNVWNVAYMSYWASSYGGMVGQAFSNELGYIQARGDTVNRNLPTVTPFQIVTNSGNNFPTANRSVTISGDGWVNVRKIMIQGRAEPLELIWDTVTRWHTQVPVSAGANNLVFQAYDFRGNLITSDSITVTSSGTGATPITNLRVTELMYDPALTAGDSDDYEYIELKNIGPDILDISGSRFDLGVTFTFPANTVMQPGAYVLVVKNQALFQSRYGAGLPVAGEYGDKLADAGEEVQLLGPGAEVIQDFTYSGAWYPTTAGQGPSLVKVAPTTALLSTWSDQTGWQASASANGSPGRDETADPTPPTVDVIDIAPDPRSAPVTSVSIHFSEAVNGVDLSDLRLTRDGTVISLAGATLTPLDLQNFTLSGAVLSGATRPAGQYVLSVLAAGSGITDVSGNPLAGDGSDAWQAYATIAGRWAFYNNSKFDKLDPLPNADDDNAIATDKTALLPGGHAGFANYTSYASGLNGIMIDVAGLPANITLSASDFTFFTGKSLNPGADPTTAWTAFNAIPAINVRPGGGAAGSDRVTLTWPETTSVKNAWLRVAMLTTHTGLLSQDVFFFGNAIGEAGNDPSNAIVDSGDYYGVRDHLRSYSDPNPVTWNWDFNRDGITDITDVMIARANPTTAATALSFFDAPAALQAGTTKNPVTSPTPTPTPTSSPSPTPTSSPTPTPKPVATPSRPPAMIRRPLVWHVSTVTSVQTATALVRPTTSLTPLVRRFG